VKLGFGNANSFAFRQLNGPELSEGHEGSQNSPGVGLPLRVESNLQIIECNQLIYIEFTVGMTYHEVRTSVKLWSSPTLGVQH